MKNLKIQSKLFVLSGMLLLLLLGVAIYQLNGLRQEKEIIEHIYTKNVTASLSLKNLRYGTQKVVQTGLDLVAGNITWQDASIVFKQYYEGDSLSTSLLTDWENYKKASSVDGSLLTEEQIAHQAEMKQVLEEKITPFLSNFINIKELLEQPQTPESTVQVNTPVIRLMVERNMLEPVFNDLVRSERYQIEKRYELSEALYANNFRLILIVIGLSVLLGILLTLRISRLIVRPIKALDCAMGKVVEGQLNLSIPVESSCELGSMSHSFNSMISQIREALETAEAQQREAELQKATAEEQRKLRDEVDHQRTYLRKSVDLMLQQMDRFANGDLKAKLTVAKQDEIGSLFQGFNHVVESTRRIIFNVATLTNESTRSTAGILETTQKLKVGTEALSTQTVNVAKAVEGISQQTSHNSRNAQAAAAEAVQNVQIANEGGDIVLQTIQKIRMIAEVVGKSADTVESLGSSSTKIGEIVSVIKDIADQTNMLALNAAIEAARAGDSGRGFAVVAEEVRKLAERTAGATDEIAQMVTTIQNDTEAVIQGMAEGHREVQEGIENADSASLALNKIIKGTQKIGDLINEIAHASNEIDEATNHVAVNIEQISEFADTSANGVSDIVQQINSLTENSDSLDESLQHYNLDLADGLYSKSTA